MKLRKVKLRKTITTIIAVSILFQCQQKTENKTGQEKLNQIPKTGNDMKISKSTYGTTKSGEQISTFSLKNGNKVEINIIEYGAIVAGIKTPDKDGQINDITLGYDDLEDWENDPYYFGATVGRVANRTGRARFTINGKTYHLATNTLPDFGNNHLHGGVVPFNKVVWKGVEFQNEHEVGVVLKYTSKDGEEGYPGNLTCQVIYSLSRKNELKILYKAITDKTTVVNMTHHSYFNLGGAGNGTVLNQQIQIYTDKYTPADEDLIPTGEIAKVKGLPVDFTTERTIASQMDEMQKAKFKGYDLNYVLKHMENGTLDLAAKAIDIASGRVLEVFTTQPCMHFYTSNFLEGKPGKEGEKYLQYGAFCFEPQGYPDAANKPQFESILLKPGEEYDQTIIYKFSTQQ